jgi:hypothetical protein
VSTQSIFSSYRGGENRVTSTMLAVFERVGLGLTERILAAATEDSSLGFASFSNQPSSGGAGVPDGEIRASFRYLIETKTEPNAVSVEQLRRHLRRLDGAYADERLLVITPDPEEPARIGRVGNTRVIWIGFGLLAQAIEGVIQDPGELASEQQRFLLRELVSYFESEGVLSVDDTVVVAARFAYPEYRKIAAYACQPNRSIRNVSRMGFYTHKQVMPEIAEVYRRFANVPFLPEEARRLKAKRDPLEKRVAEVIRWRLATMPSQRGNRSDVYILSGATDPDTLILDSPIQHTPPNAWTQGQRYTSVERLKKAKTTADL